MRFFKFLIIFTILASTQLLFAQESLKSTEEEYYDFLSLIGITERPTLNYRTLSDSEWTIKNESINQNLQEDISKTIQKDETINPETDSNADSEKTLLHPWQNNNLGTKRTLFEPAQKSENWFAKGINQNIKLKIYGPEWFNSYNTAAPYGQNDGALWQGKGYNTSLTAGARLEAYGFELTLKPQVSFSENREFEYIKPNYPATTKDGNGNEFVTIYNKKASEYGYYGVTSIDAPQRFGDSAFWTYDWGDTEIRWSWNSFTVGFGTQSIWLGPAQLNPIIHSNNAASYPKFDIGIRKTAIYMPHFGWHLGYIEARSWWGKLTESDWFDNDNSNNNNLISGLSFAYSFPFTDLTIGFNRTLSGKWDSIDSYSLFRIYIPKMNGGGDKTDQRFSFTVDWLFSNIGLETYFEWGRNDFSPNMDYIIRYPFHTQGWSAGIRKSFTFTNSLKGEILLECTNLECSADYDRLINWYSTFYAHHTITQGYTNKGQWLGSGIGTGGNSQYLGAKLYFPKGSFLLFTQRRNPDLDYTMYIDAKNDAENIKNGIFNAEANIRCLLSFGMSINYFPRNNLILQGSYIFTDDKNPLNKSKTDHHSEHRYNNSLQLELKIEI